MAAVLFLGLVFFGCASANDPVRRTNQKDSPSDMHCVVWGDGPYFGRKFVNENDADQEFKRARREELVAIHYDKRFREVQRFKSPRMKAVTWHRLADWCKDNHDEVPSSLEAMPKLEIGVGATGTFSEELIEKPKPASLIAKGPGGTRSHAKAGTDIPGPDSPVLAVRTSSTLIGKVGVIEEELTKMASQAIGVSNSIGLKSSVGALSLGGKDANKLKVRVSALEDYLGGVTNSVNALEEEIAGVSAATVAATSPIEKISVKARVESLTDKVGSLKQRLAALDTTFVVAQLPKLEERAASYSSKIVDLFKSLGFPDAAVHTVTSKNGDTFQARIAAAGATLLQAQRNTRTLGFEMLDHSWDAPKTLPGLKGFKPQLDSLTAVADDLQHRLSELDASPLKVSLDKAEKKVRLLQDKAVELSKRIGSDVPSSVLEVGANQDTSLKSRVATLERLASRAESRYEALEGELLGGAKASAQTVPHTESIKDRVKAVEAKVEGLAKRAEALEQEV